MSAPADSVGFALKRSLRCADGWRDGDHHGPGAAWPHRQRAPASLRVGRAASVATYQVITLSAQSGGKSQAGRKDGLMVW